GVDPFREAAERLINSGDLSALPLLEKAAVIAPDNPEIARLHVKASLLAGQREKAIPAALTLGNYLSATKSFRELAELALAFFPLLTRAQQDRTIAWFKPLKNGSVNCVRA